MTNPNPKPPKHGAKDMAWLDLNAKWQIAYDPLQWILRKKHLSGWDNYAYCATKSGLLTSMIRHCGAHINQEAAKTLDQLPESHAYWYGMRLTEKQVLGEDEEQNPK